MGQLDFLEIIDTHCIVVSFSREGNFYKVSHDTQFLELDRTVLRMRGYRLVRRSWRLSARNVIGSPNTVCHLAVWESVEPAPHVTARVTVLQTPRQDEIERRSRNNSELTELRYSTRQTPTGNPCAHPALNDCWKHAHANQRASIISEPTESQLFDFCNRCPIAGAA